LKVRDLIRFKISAKNADGFSIPSLFNSVGVRMSRDPSPPTPKLEDQTYTSATFSWKKVADADTYLVFYGTENGEFKKEIKTKTTSFTAKNLP
jgi:hypothetical protein